MRYTEARLAPIAEEMLVDIDKDTVDHAPNFDGTLQEPTVLPACLPNLIVNGSTGIAVGMATNIPPHNLTEVAGAITHIIDQISATVEKGVPFDVVWARCAGAPVDPAALAAAVKSLPRPLLAAVREQIGARADADAVVRAVIAMADAAVDVPPDALLEHIKGPDFPTGGTIIGVEGIRSAYTTGRGRITVRARVSVEDIRGGRQAIIVGELPYQVNKASLIEKIADLIRDRKLEGISDVRDESDREGMRVVIELKREVQPRTILNQLYKFTAMQSAFSANMVALVDGQPRVLTLRTALVQYVIHRKEVVTRRTEHGLGKAKARAHILEGLKIALDNLDAVIATIRASRDADTARTALINKFKLTEIQAQAILDMQLRRLAALERKKILDELAEVRKLITHLEDLLAHPIKIVRLVRDELAELKAKYGDARRTVIVEHEVVDFSEEDLIQESDVVIVVSNRDYVKRMPADAYRSRGRGARNQIVSSAREDDTVQHLLVTKTHSSVLFFTNQGRVFQVKAHEVPEAARQARGLPLVNLVKLAERETVTAVVATPDFEASRFLLTVTRAGEVKRLALSELASARPSGLGAVAVPDGDELAWARLIEPGQDAVLVTGTGQAIRFAGDELRPSGRGSGGVRGIKLDAGDSVAGADVIEPDGEMVVVTERGLGKRLPIDEFPRQGRGGGGVRAMTTTEKTGRVATARVVGPADEVLIVSREGIIVQAPVGDVPRMGRAAQGQVVVRLAPSDRVATMARLRADDDTPAARSGAKTGRAGRGAAPVQSPASPRAEAGRSRADATAQLALPLPVLAEPARARPARRSPKAAAEPSPTPAARTEPAPAAASPARPTPAPPGRGAKAPEAPPAATRSRRAAEPTPAPPLGPSPKLRARKPAADVG
jgi:DNA gyrase subunit A